MEHIQDYIDVPIDLENHSWFMYVASKVRVEVKIISGNYRIFFDDPAELFQMGMQVARGPVNKDFYTHYGFPKK